MSRGDPAVSEETLINHMVARVPHRQGPFGPGDDAALLPALEGDQQRVCTTDLMVEAVHFLRPHPPGWLGHKLLAVNLSDVAAMGAMPEAFVVNAALPANVRLTWWDELAGGIGALATEAGATLVGGDVVRSPGPIMLGVTAWGVCVDVPLLRSGARPGDVAMVRAPQGLGVSRQGLARWLEIAGSSSEFGGEPDPAWATDPALCAHLRPTPDLAAGPWAAAAGATAALDVSDGLLVDAARLARSSCVQLDLDLDRLPGPALLSDAPSAHERAAGGEDYALLVLVPADKVSAFEERGFQAIGAASRGHSVVWRDGGRTVSLDDASAFQHFDGGSGA